MTIEISANAVSWYAAIVATISAGASVYNAWRDRSRLVFRFMPNMQMVGDLSAKRCLYTSIANAGRRPITISHLHFSDKRQDRFKKLMKAIYSIRKFLSIPTDDYVNEYLIRESIKPIELKEGQSHTYQCDLEKDIWKTVRYISVCDSVGGIHTRKIPSDVKTASLEKKDSSESNGQEG